MKTCLLCESTSAGTAVRFRNQYAKICTWCQGELKRSGRGWCPRCERAYPLVEMRDGYCKAHKHEINAAYHAAHRERQHQRVNAWKAANPDWRRRYSRRRKRTSEQDKARYHRWYRANHTRARAAQRAYVQAQAAANPNYWRDRYQQAKVRAWRKTREEI